MRKLMIALLLLVAPAMAQAASHQVTLSWTDSTDSASTYNVYRASGTCSTSLTFTLVGSAPAGATTYTDTTVSVGLYCYQATSVLNGAESVASNQAQARILPAPPTTLTVTGSQ